MSIKRLKQLAEELDNLQRDLNNKVCEFDELTMVFEEKLVELTLRLHDIDKTQGFIILQPSGTFDRRVYAGEFIYRRHPSVEPTKPVETFTTLTNGSVLTKTDIYLDETGAEYYEVRDIDGNLEGFVKGE